MKFSRLFALFMVAATLVGTVPVEAAKHRSSKRSKQAKRAPVRQAPAAPAEQDANYAPARHDRRPKMTAEQIKRLRMQRVIRNVLFAGMGALVLYAADQGFNLRGKMMDILNSINTAKNVRDQGKDVLNGVKGLFGVDLTGAQENDDSFLGDEFYG